MIVLIYIPEVENMAITLLSYNFKGGVGKTTLTGIEAWIMAKQGKKILLVDFDPQANLTEMMQATFHHEIIPRVSLYKGLLNHNLSSTLVHISDHIDMLPADWSLSQYMARSAKIPESKRYFVLDYLLRPFKENYDYILLDVPPTLGVLPNNAIFAADGISIVLQTQKSSYTSAIKTVQQLATFRNNYHAQFTFLGVILYLYRKAKVDRNVIKASKNTFSDVLYANKIRFQERVKGFTDSGIRYKDMWDKRAIDMYKLLVYEMESKAKKMIK